METNHQWVSFAECYTLSVILVGLLAECYIWKQITFGLFGETVIHRDKLLKVYWLSVIQVLGNKSHLVYWLCVIHRNLHIWFIG